ncbi:hypothetical protein PFICI_05088 [Pestalotiopsis fici W106-1]|uniref:Cupin type-2 domain-containing protein n=1 Tax=Pestalotiopsis fici (strain W106-1 / CGMCC3.15140) TaxID=1229662 RepID=W3XCQ9_PESFW|nr:uncharacterized protein PFICI_05088 [Pestalotiopsis fici W106-1]ETS83212.1 hypothetical protein PFICI_05088 [Pestalotiopsis fici W106-1]
MSPTKEAQTAVEQATAKVMERCKESNSYPMWTVTDKVSKLQPNPRALPTQWKWSQMRNLMLEAGSIVPEEMAERRALMMVNPGIPTHSGASPYTTDTLYAGFQLVLPGETAPAHRHMAYAVRFVLESSQGFTSVAGHKMYLQPGDLVLTPSWQWHYHGNDGNGPTFWVDCLDMPMHMFAKVNFLELYPTAKVPDLLTQGSPFHFSWKDVKMELDSQRGSYAVFHYRINGSAFSCTIAAQAERFGAGSSTSPLRETVSKIYVVQSGRGSTKISTPTGAEVIEWSDNDVFVVPAWS